PERQGTREPALPIGPAPATATDVAPPGPDPGILVVEDEWHAEAPRERGPEQRRIRRGDPHTPRVEALGGQKAPAGAPETGERAQAKIADAERSREPRREGPAAHDPHAGRHPLRALRVEPPLAVARGHGADG